MNRPTGGLRIAVSAVLLASATGCAAAPGVAPGSACSSAPGTTCAGPAAMGSWLFGDLTISADGLMITGTFQCGGGGHLAATEARTQVRLVFTAPEVMAGAGSCALATIAVRLDAPLGGRTLLDGVSGATLTPVPSQT